MNCEGNDRITSNKEDIFIGIVDEVTNPNRTQ